ncbi:YpuI family protein [Paenibacillus sp. N1-5-1-14]|uniref:YpuI family protein n=1 Tax=Paenibacillus radicibacter TaxID=2972488 RepID=UPI0021597A3F|nr:YpuI family protein [Paenibacillus radicibacter]MCR8641958.1 YpuI family protein [Paenibacillus radicibacter]
MAMFNVKNICESSRARLKDSIDKMEQFLNHHSLSQLNVENDPAMDEFYRNYLQDTRHLLVFCEVSYEKLGVALRRPTFNTDYAEKALYDVFHSCVSSFFYPKNECYSEDGRYAYTGQDAIRFRKKPCREARDLIIDLSKIFEELREELAYYETDYVTQRRLQGEKI